MLSSFNRRLSTNARTLAGRFTFSLGGAMICAWLFAGVALATAPTYSSQFTCSKANPCGAFESFSPGEGLGRVAVDEATGDVYVIDVGHRVIDKFSASGEYLSQLNGSNTTAGSFLLPGDPDVAVDNIPSPNQGDVYVSSEQQSILFAFDNTGKFLWQHDFEPYSSTKAVDDICGVGVDPTGRIWAADYAKNNIQQLDPSNGTLTGETVDTSGRGELPCHFSFDSAGNLYAAQWHNRTLSGSNIGASETDVYVSGVFSKALDTLAPTFAISTDASFNDDVYLAQGHQVAVYNSSGAAVAGTPFNGAATPAGSLVPNGVAIDGTTGKIYVTDEEHAVVDVFDGPVPPPKPILIVIPAGTGSGSVSADSGAISNCSAAGGVCSGRYALGATVTLTPTASNSTFTGWSGGGCSGPGACTVSMNSDTTVTATFAQDAPSVTTGGTSSVTASEARAAGTVNPNGGNVTLCHIEYGASLLHGSRSQASCSPAPGSGTEAAAVGRKLVGLSPDTEYHYRVIATNSGGTSEGAEMAFRTGDRPVVMFLEEPAEIPIGKVEQVIGQAVEKPAVPLVTKPTVKLTRGRLPAQTLKQCKKLPKRKRAACIKKAKKSKKKKKRS